MSKDYATKKDVEDIVDNAVKTDVQGMIDRAVKTDVQGMIDKAIKTDVQGMIDKAVEDLSMVISGFADQVDSRFNDVEREVVDLKKSHDRLQSTIDNFVKRLDEQELDTAAQDSRFEKLLAWAREVSQRTGIPLKDL